MYVFVVGARSGYITVRDVKRWMLPRAGNAWEFGNGWRTLIAAVITTRMDILTTSAKFRVTRTDRLKCYDCDNNNEKVVRNIETCCDFGHMFFFLICTNLSNEFSVFWFEY